MPIFRVTATVEERRTVVAYVEASNRAAADNWGSNAPDHLWRDQGEASPTWGEIQSVELVEAAPDGWRVSTVPSTTA